MTKIGTFSEYQWSKISFVFNGLTNTGNYELKKLPSGRLNLYADRPDLVLYRALAELYCAQIELDSQNYVERILNGGK